MVMWELCIHIALRSFGDGILHTYQAIKNQNTQVIIRPIVSQTQLGLVERERETYHSSKFYLLFFVPFSSLSIPSASHKASTKLIRSALSMDQFMNKK